MRIHHRRLLDLVFLGLGVALLLVLWFFPFILCAPLALFLSLTSLPLMILRGLFLRVALVGGGGCGVG